MLPYSSQHTLSLSLSGLRGSQIVVPLGPGTCGVPLSGSTPRRSGSGGSANRGLEVSFPPLLQCLATSVTFGWAGSLFGSHPLPFPESAPVPEPSGLFRVTSQACALHSGGLMSLFHFLRTFLPRLFSLAGWVPSCLLLKPHICLSLANFTLSNCSPLLQTRT